jgi:hypothetical protein
VRQRAAPLGARGGRTDPLRGDRGERDVEREERALDRGVLRARERQVEDVADHDDREVAEPVLQQDAADPAHALLRPDVANQPDRAQRAREAVVELWNARVSSAVRARRWQDECTMFTSGKIHFCAMTPLPEIAVHAPDLTIGCWKNRYPTNTVVRKSEPQHTAVAERTIREERRGEDRDAHSNRDVLRVPLVGVCG